MRDTEEFRAKVNELIMSREWRDYLCRVADAVDALRAENERLRGALAEVRAVLEVENG